MKGGPLVSVVIFRNCQPRVRVLPSGRRKLTSIERQHLDHTQSEGVGRVESGRALFRARVPGILGQGLQHHARARDRAAEHRAGVVR